MTTSLMMTPPLLPWVKGRHHGWGPRMRQHRGNQSLPLLRATPQPGSPPLLAQYRPRCMEQVHLRGSQAALAASRTADQAVWGALRAAGRPPPSPPLVRRVACGQGCLGAHCMVQAARLLLLCVLQVHTRPPPPIPPLRECGGPWMRDPPPSAQHPMVAPQRCSLGGAGRRCSRPPPLPLPLPLCDFRLLLQLRPRRGAT